MLDKLENKISMYYTVNTFFTANISKLTPTLPALTAHHDEFNDLVTQLEIYLNQSNQNNVGYAEQKKMLREICRTKTLELGSALRAYFLSIQNYQLAEKVTFTKSFFNKKRDAELNYLCDSIYDIAQAHAAQIIPYGYTLVRIAEVPESYIDFKNFITQPYDERYKSTEATIKANQLFTLADKKLSIIDSLMLSIESKFEMLYLQYTFDRAINDTGSKRKKTEIHKFTLKPEMISMVLQIPYLKRRVFTFINPSNEQLFWNLSTQNNAFSETPHGVEAFTEAVKSSNVLANAGDFLLVHNPSKNEVEIEVKVK